MTTESTSANIKPLHKIVLAGGAVAIGIGLAACGGSSDSTSSPSPTATDLPTSASPTGAATLPSGWDAPEPVNTTLKSSSNVDGVLGATFEGSGSLKAAADAYAKQLQADGWKADENNVVNTNAIWFKGSKRLQVSGADTQSGKYVLAVTIEPKQ